MQDKILEAIKKAIGIEEVHIEAPEIEVYGDYSTNVAMVLAKKEGKNPKEVAKELLQKILSDKDIKILCEKVEIAGPGFINFWLSYEALLGNLKEVNIKGEEYGSSGLGGGKCVVIDYSAPNIAKRFGIGHLRSTVIGQALYNLYKFLGYKVIGDNHIGDWGTQFGTLLYQIDSKGLNPAKLTVDELENLYVEFNSEAQKYEKLWDEARGWFKKLEEKDPKANEVWKAVLNTSLREFNRIYELLGVKIDYTHGESFYEDKMMEILDELRKKGLVKKSEGAEIIELAGMTPAMLTKSDGTTTYFTRDLATIKFRIGEWNPDIVIYEVGNDQILHFRQVFAATKLINWNNKIHYEHVAHGLIRLPHGKMSTRHGETVKLEDVLNEAIARAKNIIDKSETPLRHGFAGQAGRGLSHSEKDNVAKAVGIGAVKYFDLTHHPATDIIFDWDKIFVLEGNSAPYLQYTYARTQSVLRKTQKLKNSKTPNLKIGNPSTSLRPSALRLRLEEMVSLSNQWKVETNAEEILVLRSLVRFSDVIVSAAKNYSPNLLTNYLFNLAQKYNNFYNLHRILPSEKEIGDWKLEIGNFRLALTRGVGQVLNNGLTILGIETPEKM